MFEVHRSSYTLVYERGHKATESKSGFPGYYSPVFGNRAQPTY